MPSREQWQREITAREFDLVLDEFSTREHVGMVPVRLVGKEEGFEYYFDPVDGGDPAEERDDELARTVGTRNHVVTFKWFGSDQDGRAAEIAATVLASIADGVFYDPQDGLFAVGDKAFELVEAQRLTERERKLALSETKWANVTERRCPNCGARCPEYRAHCWVCEIAIGRVDTGIAKTSVTESVEPSPWWKFW